MESPELTAFIEKYSPFFKEAKKRALGILGVFAVAMVMGFYFYEEVIGFLVRTLSLEGINIVFTSPFQYINLAISCGVVTGLVVVMPFIAVQILNFLRPALSRKEFKVVVGFVPYSLILFLIGFGFGAVIMKWQIEIFLARSAALGIGNILDISGLLSTIFLTSGFLGVGFQFPIVLLLLSRLGIVNHRQLSKKRPWIYLGSFVFALFLPPDSILADILLALPLVILYEITMILDLALRRKTKG